MHFYLQNVLDVILRKWTLFLQEKKKDTQLQFQEVFP